MPAKSLALAGEERSYGPRTSTVRSIGSPEAFWKNANSGVAHWSDVVLYTYALYSLLCDRDLEREGFLNRVEVNGYMRSLRYTSDVAALLHNELLLRVWAVPSDLLSARAYQTHLQLVAPFTASPSSLYVMKQNFQDGFWTPFERALKPFGPRLTLVREARLTGIRLAGDRVDEILVRHKGESSPRVEKVKSLIVAIPPQPWLSIVRDPESRALRGKAPELLDLRKLESQQTSALTLYFNRRIEIPGVGDEPVALVDDLETIYAKDTLAQRNGLASKYGISFIDVAALWKADHPTVLSVLASDAESLVELDEDEARDRILDVLKEYVPFESRDIDWDYSDFQSHRGAPVFANTVGSWEYRPEVRLVNSKHKPLIGQIWTKVPNLYLAGDYCRSQIDFVSLEGAIHTGIWAARALSQRERPSGRGEGGVVAPPIQPVPFDKAQQARAEEIRVRLERWPGLAKRRSLLVKAKIEAAARASNESESIAGVDGRETRARWPGFTPRAMASLDTPRPSTGGAVMSEALSTFSGFAEPFRSAETAWLDKHQDEMKRIALPNSGVAVAVPLLLWEVQALCLDGTADADAVDGLLQQRGLRAQRENGKAIVQIWAPDYGGTTVGPFKAVYGAIRVRPRERCQVDHPNAMHMCWWWYYGNSAVNQEFKQHVWGILDNRLAPIETSYLTSEKEVRLLENGRVALRLRLRCNEDRKWADKKVRAPSFQTVAQRVQDDGENGVELHDYGPVYTEKDRAGYELYFGKGLAIDEHLKAIDFAPTACEFHSGYNGIVKIYDDKGGGPPIPAEDPVVKSMKSLVDLFKGQGQLGAARKSEYGEE